MSPLAIKQSHVAVFIMANETGQFMRDELVLSVEARKKNSNRVYILQEANFIEATIPKKSCRNDSSQSHTSQSKRLLSCAQFNSI